MACSVLKVACAARKVSRAVLQSDRVVEDFSCAAVRFVDAACIAENAVVELVVAVKLSLKCLKRLSAACCLLNSLGYLSPDLLALHVALDRLGDFCLDRVVDS